MGGEGSMAHAITTLRSNAQMLRKTIRNKKTKSFLGKDKLNDDYYEGELFDDLEPMDKTDVHSQQFNIEYFILSLIIIGVIVVGFWLI